MMVAPASRTSPGWSALTVAFVPTGMNWGVSTTPCASVSRPSRACVDPSVAGGARSSNDAAPVTSPPVEQREDDGHHDRHDEHRAERDEDRDVLALDRDVARQVAEDRDPRPEHHHDAHDRDQKAHDDEQPPHGLHPLPDS